MLTRGNIYGNTIMIIVISKKKKLVTYITLYEFDYLFRNKFPQSCFSFNKR